MGFSAVYNTDVGIKKKTNQDSLAIKIADTPNGQVVFSLVCDGMGGLAKGEVASKEVITAFCNWFDTQFVEMVDNNSFSEELLRYQWIRLAVEQNEKIKAYGEQNGFMLGTTISAILIYREMYYILHVGDSRVYEITSGIRRLLQGRSQREDLHRSRRRRTADEACFSSVSELHLWWNRIS